MDGNWDMRRQTFFSVKSISTVYFWCTPKNEKLNETRVVSVHKPWCRCYEAMAEWMKPAWKPKRKKKYLEKKKTLFIFVAFSQLKQLLVGLSPGSLLWLVGWLMNVHSDHILRNLRKPGETGYKIPTGKSHNHETLDQEKNYLSPTTTNICITPVYVTWQYTVRHKTSKLCYTVWHLKGFVYYEME